MAHVAILAGYVVLALLAVALALPTRGRRPYASPTAVVATIMSHPAGRWIVLLLWMWVGWHFFVRGSD
jgi:uncharacterized protein DUF6186